MIVKPLLNHVSAPFGHEDKVQTQERGLKSWSHLSCYFSSLSTPQLWWTTMDVFPYYHICNHMRPEYRLALSRGPTDTPPDCGRWPSWGSLRPWASSVVLTTVPVRGPPPLLLGPPSFIATSLFPSLLTVVHVPHLWSPLSSASALVEGVASFFSAHEATIEGCIKVSEFTEDLERCWKFISQQQKQPVQTNMKQPWTHSRLAPIPLLGVSHFSQQLHPPSLESVCFLLPCLLPVTLFPLWNPSSLLYFKRMSC